MYIQNVILQAINLGQQRHHNIHQQWNCPKLQLAITSLEPLWKRVLMALQPLEESLRTKGPILQQVAELLETTATETLQDSTDWMVAGDTCQQARQILQLPTSFVVSFMQLSCEHM